MNYILMAIPLFMLLILIEFAWDRYKGTGFYRLNDSVNSLAMGIYSRVTGLLFAMIPFSAYILIYENASLVTLPVEDTWVWVAAFVIYDLGYYWNHRIGHTLNISWASHVIHHQSEEYNLTTALRQTSIPNVTGWAFFIPMALLGFPPIVLFAAGSFNLIYQFWVHTQHIKKLPAWYEAIFVTPSHHRVHHGKNKVYIDKNHGGVFILWDKIFGTFQVELENEKVIYGISTQLASWNPIKGNVQFIGSLIQDAWRTNNWFDKFTLWFRLTGYRPADMEEKYPRIKSNEAVVKYDIENNKGTKIYIFSQLIFCLVLVFAFLTMAKGLEVIQLTSGCGVLGLFLLSLSKVQEAKPLALAWEVAKFSALIVTVAFIIPMAAWVAPVLIAISVASLFALHFVGRQKLQPELA